jgi:MFS-type transporter involved in bile tolerance (Atg22 family)
MGEENMDMEPIFEEEMVSTPDFTGIMIYGVIADCMVVLPILFYMVLDTTGYSKHHQTMVNMMTSSWMPFAIIWMIVLFNDTPTSRLALSGALEMAALGPFALQWVGYMAFLMSAQASGVLGEVSNVFWAIAYPLLNITLIIVHWLMSEGIYNWIENGASPAEEVEAEPTMDEEEFEEEF